MAGTLLMAKKVTEQAAACGPDTLATDEVSHIRACYAGRSPTAASRTHPSVTGNCHGPTRWSIGSPRTAT
jgi:transposase